MQTGSEHSPGPIAFRVPSVSVGLSTASKCDLSTLPFRSKPPRRLRVFLDPPSTTNKSERRQGADVGGGGRLRLVSDTTPRHAGPMRAASSVLHGWMNRKVRCVEALEPTVGSCSRFCSLLSAILLVGCLLPSSAFMRACVCVASTSSPHIG